MNTLQYGLEVTETNKRLFLDVPTDLAVSMQSESPVLAAELRDLSKSKSRVLEIEPIDDSLRITLNADRIGAKRDDQEQRKLAHRTATVFNDIDWHAGERKDPRANVQMPNEYSTDGRLRMRAEVAWPERATDTQASEFVTTVMQGIAFQLKYQRRMIPELVGAQIIRERGVTLETNPMGSCNIGAGGYHYLPEQPTVELYQHNIYSPIQQLICFAGAIAMARADEFTVS